MSRRTAAALLVTRGEGSERKVFLAERAPQLRFFGGYWALPGGTLSESDFATAPGDESIALQNCAHRELFEELGLLRHSLPIARTRGEALRTAREQLLQHEADAKHAPSTSPWPSIIHGAAAPEPLRELCRIATPAFAPVRYDTTFFHVPIESCLAGTGGQCPEVWNGELRQGRYWYPQQALASWRNGDLLLVPPVVILLEHLARAADFAAFRQAISATAARYHSGHLHQVRFSPGIVMAPLRSPTLPPATTTNCCIVGHQQLWVIDPGSPHHDEQQRLLQLLAELTAQGARVAGILATHHHPDHVGGIAALSQALQVPVRGHQLTLDRLPAGFLRGEELADGDKIALGCAPDGNSGWELLAVHTPGHDRGHLCFRESRYGAMVVGDMLSTISTIIIDPPEGHLATYLASLQRLEGLSMSTLYPAHGPAMRDGNKLISQYLRHRRQRETKLVEVLAKHSGTLTELLPLVYWDADPSSYSFAARSLLAGLLKLRDEGRAFLHGERWSNAPTA